MIRRDLSVSLTIRKKIIEGKIRGGRIKEINEGKEIASKVLVSLSNGFYLDLIVKHTNYKDFTRN